MTNQMFFFLYGDISSISTIILKKKLNGYRTSLHLISSVDKVCEVICRIEGELTSRRDLVIPKGSVSNYNDREIIDF